MTEPTYTLEEARLHLARLQCEEDLMPDTLYARSAKVQLGHCLVIVRDGTTGQFRNYWCERCGTTFTEAAR